MNDGAVIETISITLVSLLEGEIDKLPSGRFSVTLKAPTEEMENDSQGINLFLYRISENAELRNQPWIREENNLLRYPPLFLNLHYLITPYAKEQRDAHRILTETMRIFHDYSNQELSVGAQQSHQLRIVLEPLSIEDLFKIWRALRRPYHLSISYCVQVARIESKRERKVEIVRERDIRLHEVPIIHGR
ncbi:MAG: DUF4255 domain-containing protein [bacterium]